MPDTKTFWAIVGIVYVVTEAISRLIGYDIARRRRVAYDRAVDKQCQWLADALGIDREHVYINDRGQVDLTPEGREQHDQNVGLRVVSEEGAEYGGTITRYERLDA